MKLPVPEARGYGVTNLGNQTAKQKGNSQPIVRHPLFPAIVALWFAALFGLGSMALRASLLESLVIASRIDLVVPQAAPPLGITARIMVAAIMAVLGGLIGGAIARRMARPKPVARERRRGAAPIEASRPVSRYAAPDPLPFDEPETVAQPSVANRRGSLVVADDPRRNFTLHEAAPLPGSQPQILDVTAFDVNGIGQPEIGQTLPEAGELALELGEFAASEQMLPVEIALVEQAVVGDAGFAGPQAPVQDLAGPSEPEPVAAVRSFDAPAAQSFQAPVEPYAGNDPAPAEAAPADFARPFEAPQLHSAGIARAFDAPQAEQAEQPLASGDMPFSAPLPQEFAAPGPADACSLLVPEPDLIPPQAFAAASDDPADNDPAGAIWGAPAELLPEPPLPEPEPVPAALARLPSETAVAGEAHPSADSEAGEDDPMATLRNQRAPLPVIHFEPEPDPVPEPEVHEQFVATAAEAAQVPDTGAIFTPPGGAAAQKLASADLAELSPVELIERLALTLQRRRQDRQESPAAAQAAFASAALPDPVAEPAAEIAPWQPFGPSPQFTGDTTEEPQACEEPAGAATANSRLALPAALRPIDFSEYEHDDDQPAFVPARSISMPPPPEADAGTGSMPDYFALARESEALNEVHAAEESGEPGYEAAAPRVDASAEASAESGAEDSAEDNDDVLAAGYSSLLNMSRPVEQRQQFVRIEDPEAEIEAAEPVVIFPGQAKRAGTQFAAPPQGPLVAPAASLSSLAESDGQTRRFDAPSQYGGARDPDETERALRSALATLQRMSGAA